MLRKINGDMKHDIMRRSKHMTQKQAKIGGEQRTIILRLPKEIAEKFIEEAKQRDLSINAYFLEKILASEAPKSKPRRKK